MPTKLQKIRARPQPDCVTEERNLIKLAEQEFALSRDHWEELDLPVDLEWTIERFDVAARSRIPNDHRGVYTFVVRPGIANHPACSYLFYVGMAERQSLRVRFNQYLRDKRDTNTRRYHIRDLLNRWDGYIWFCFAKIDNFALISAVEQQLLSAYLPPFNRDFRGNVRPAIRVLR